MKRHGKRFTSALKNVDIAKEYSYREAVELVKKNATAKFDESFEVAIRLGVDPRKADQLVRGTVSLPHGTGKSVRVLVMARSPKDAEALAAGADYAGLEEYSQKIQAGWADIDVIIATPDVMGEVGKLGRILGPRGLMPNPKSGTVTFDVAKAMFKKLRDKGTKIYILTNNGWAKHPAHFVTLFQHYDPQMKQHEILFGNQNKLRKINQVFTSKTRKLHN